MEPFLKYKVQYLMMSKKKNHYLCEDQIEKSIPQDHRCHHLASLVMSNCDPWDGFFYPTLTYMIISCTITFENGIFQEYFLFRDGDILGKFES